MPNQQMFPANTYPITGDVQSTPGSPRVTTVGFQGTGVVPTKPTDGQVYVYVNDIDKWVPADPVVSGPNTPGTPATANPVQVGGVDDGNLVRELRTDTYGSLRLQRVEELLSVLIAEVRAVKLAIIALDSTNNPADYTGASYLEIDPVE